MNFRVPVFLALAGVLHAGVLAAVVTQSWIGRAAPSPAPLAVMLIGGSRSDGATPPAAVSASAVAPTSSPAALSTAAPAPPPAAPVRDTALAKPPLPPVPLAAPPPRPRPPDRVRTPSATSNSSVQTAARPIDAPPIAALQARPADLATGIDAEGQPAAPPAEAALTAQPATAAESRTATIDAKGDEDRIERTRPRIDASWQGNTPPAYPLRARRAGEQGEVLLDVHVDEQGRVTEVLIKRSSGSNLLDRAAIGAVRDWRFQPATVGGEPVADWYRDWRWVFRLAG